MNSNRTVRHRFEIPALALFLASIITFFIPQPGFANREDSSNRPGYAAEHPSEHQGWTHKDFGYSGRDRDYHDSRHQGRHHFHKKERKDFNEGRHGRYPRLIYTYPYRSQDMYRGHREEYTSGREEEMLEARSIGYDGYEQPPQEVDDREYQESEQGRENSPESRPETLQRQEPPSREKKDFGYTWIEVDRDKSEPDAGLLPNRRDITAVNPGENPDRRFETKAEEFGRLVLDIQPSGTEIHVDGKYLDKAGNLNNKRILLKPGEHEFLLRAGGKSVSFSLIVDKGSESILSRDLRTK